MAYESNLPANSERFSQTLWKDENNRIWTGKTGEYYRFLDSADMPYINIKDYGAVGDGVTDDTDAWESALSVAKAEEMALYFPSGRYPISVDVDTVNMNGCSGLAGLGEMVVTSNGDVDAPLLQWAGTKERVSGAVPVAVMQNTFMIDAGKNIEKGDTMFIVSSELLSSDMTVRYVKGGRYTVNTYDSVTGELVLFEYSYFDITDGYFFHNSSRPRVQLQDVKITFITDSDKKGIEVLYGEVFANNIQIDGFGRFGLNVSSSLGRIFNSTINGRSVVGTPSGYGLQASDAAEVFASGCTFNGARHGVACSGMAYWLASDVDAPPTPTVWIRPPNIVRISGCRVSGDDYAVDSHSGTVLLDVYNCDIYGGVQLGGVETYVNLSRIDQGPSNSALRFGRDRTAASGVFHSRFAIRNCEVRVRTKVFWVYSDIEDIELSDLNIFTYGTPDATFTGFISNSVVNNWKIGNIRHFGQPSDIDVEYDINAVSPILVQNFFSRYAGLRVMVRSSSVRTITLIGADIRDAENRGFAVSAAGTSFQNTYDVSIISASFSDLPDAGLSLFRCRNISVSGSHFRNCGQSILITEQTGGDMNLAISGCNIRQTSGNVIHRTGSQVVNTVLTGNMFDGSTDMNVNVVGKYGNIGLDDKLKTALTTASTDKYGSDTTTGDLTLS